MTLLPLKILCVALILAGVPESVFALNPKTSRTQDVCQDVFASGNTQIFHDRQNLETVPRSILIQYHFTIANVNKKIAGPFKIPSEVLLVVDDGLVPEFRSPDTVIIQYTPNLLFDPSRLSISYIYRHLKPRDKPIVVYKHPKYSLIDLGHEYGHMIFETNIVDYGDTFNLVSKYLYERMALLSQIETLPTDHKKQRRALRKELKALDQAHSKFNAIGIALKNTHESICPVENIPKAYEEFFADLIAVVHSNDPAAPQKSGHFSGAPKAHQKIRKFRSFVKSQSLSQHSASDYHGWYHEVRQHVWKHYLSNAEFNGKDVIAKTIHRIFEALVDDFNRTVEFGSDLPLDVRSSNQRLIEAIDKKFKEK